MTAPSVRPAPCATFCRTGCTGSANTVVPIAAIATTGQYRRPTRISDATPMPSENDSGGALPDTSAQICHRRLPQSTPKKTHNPGSAAANLDLKIADFIFSPDQRHTGPEDLRPHNINLNAISLIFYTPTTQIGGVGRYAVYVLMTFLVPRSPTVYFNYIAEFLRESLRIFAKETWEGVRLPLTTQSSGNRIGSSLLVSKRRLSVHRLVRHHRLRDRPCVIGSGLRGGVHPGGGLTRC